jgi:hypothetical protein
LHSLKNCRNAQNEDPLKSEENVQNYWKWKSKKIQSESKKATKRKRHLRGSCLVGSANSGMVNRLLCIGG